MPHSSTSQKVAASTVNCVIVFTASVPFYLMFSVDAWRAATVILFFSYNMIFRKRCIGMMLVGTYSEKPASPVYAALYTLSFSTVLWYWIFPLDLALAYGFTVQAPCVMLTGNTLHGWITNEGTRTNNI
jgi:hypothetical protein